MLANDCWIELFTSKPYFLCGVYTGRVAARGTKPDCWTGQAWYTVFPLSADGSRIAIIPPVRITLSGCNGVVATADGVGMRRRFLINILLPLSFFPKNAAPTIIKKKMKAIRFIFRLPHSNNLMLNSFNLVVRLGEYWRHWWKVEGTTWWWWIQFAQLKLSILRFWTLSPVNLSPLLIWYKTKKQPKQPILLY